MLSIIIVNWNTRQHLEKCLRSIAAWPPVTEYEVIVVENDSQDGSAEMVSSLFPTTKLILPGINSGYAKGNNLGFAVAKGDLVLTLNPDTEFEDDSLARAVSRLEASPELGSIAIPLIGPDGEIQASVRGFPSLLGIFGQLTGLDRIWPRSAFASYRLPNFNYFTNGFAPQPMGTFVLFRRDALAQVGDPAAPFDENFPIYFNDVDLSFRLDQAGLLCLFVADLHVRHHHGASTNQRRKSMIWESHNSLLRYFKKHGKGVTKLLLPLLAAAIWVGAFVRAKGYDAGFRPLHHNM